MGLYLYFLYTLGRCLLPHTWGNSLHPLLLPVFLSSVPLSISSLLTCQVVNIYILLSFQWGYYWHEILFEAVVTTVALKWKIQEPNGLYIMFKDKVGDSPGGPVVKTPSFQCKGPYVGKLRSRMPHGQKILKSICSLCSSNRKTRLRKILSSNFRHPGDKEWEKCLSNV